MFRSELLAPKLTLVLTSQLRGSPLWEDCDAQMNDRVQIEPDRDLTAQAAPGDLGDPRVSWWAANPRFDPAACSRPGF